MNVLILLAFAAYAVRAIKKDTVKRDGISTAVWIPTIWVGILASRPISMWLDAGGDSTQDGSPIDAAVFLFLIVAASVVVVKRGVNLPRLIARNWPVALFYGFLLVSVVWTHTPLISLKRWIKEAGNIAVVLVLLTEVNPSQAIRTVFVRCGYVLIPLSLVFLRYFPEIGRRYSVHSGEMEATGVTCQKNSLGAMILVCGLVIFWDILEFRSERKQRGEKPRKGAFILSYVVLLIGAYLLSVCDSKTSIVCLALGSSILIAARLPILRNKVRVLEYGVYITAIAYTVLDQVFGIKDELLHDLGRNATLTGRTDVWQAILGLDLDPYIGTGFMSFWDDPHFRSRLPDWVAFSAHNGYLEIYIAGGFVGLFFLAIMILGTAGRIHKALSAGTSLAVFRFAFFIIALLANISESNFACMSPIGFLFLLVAIDLNPSTRPVPSIRQVSERRANIYRRRPEVRAVHLDDTA